MKLKIGEWRVSNDTITFQDDRFCYCPGCCENTKECHDKTEIRYNTEFSVYYIRCSSREHRHRVTASVADRIDEYCDIKKIVISDKETDFVLTIDVLQSINYKRRFG